MLGWTQYVVKITYRARAIWVRYSTHYQAIKVLLTQKLTQNLRKLGACHLFQPNQVCRWVKSLKRSWKIKLKHSILWVKIHYKLSLILMLLKKPSRKLNFLSFKISSWLKQPQKQIFYYLRLLVLNMKVCIVPLTVVSNVSIKPLSQLAMSRMTG